MYTDMIQNYGMPNITCAMFLSAMNTLVEKLETKNKKLIFLLVSDDPNLVKKKMLPRMKGRIESNSCTIFYTVGIFYIFIFF